MQQDILLNNDPTEIYQYLFSEKKNLRREKKYNLGKDKWTILPTKQL